MESQKHRILLDKPFEVFTGSDPDIVGRHYVNLIRFAHGSRFPTGEGEEINYIKSELPNGNTRVQLVFDFR